MRLILLTVMIVAMIVLLFTGNFWQMVFGFIWAIGGFFLGLEL